MPINKKINKKSRRTDPNYKKDSLLKMKINIYSIKALPI